MQGSPIIFLKAVLWSALLWLFSCPLSAQDDPSYLLGLRYFQAAQYPQAVEHFKRALQLNPDHIDARYSIGKIYFMQEKYLSSYRYLRDSLAIDPGYKDAPSLFEQSLERIYTRFSDTLSDPQVVGAITTRSFRKGDLIAARRGIEYLVKKHPRFAVGWDHLGEYYLRQKNLEKAMTAMKKALALDPSSPTIFHHYEKIYFLKNHQKVPDSKLTPPQTDLVSKQVQDVVDESILLGDDSSAASAGPAQPIKLTKLEPAPPSDQSNSKLFEKLLEKESRNLPEQIPETKNPTEKNLKRADVYVPPPEPKRDLQAEQNQLELRAQKALQEKNWELAATSYAILSNNNPNNKEFKQSFEKAREYDRFEQNFQQALKTLKRGTKDSSQFKKAKELFLQLDSVIYAQLHQKQSFDEYLAFISFALKDYQEAEKICKTWVKQEPDSFQAHYLLLKSLESQEKYQEAYYILAKASQIDSSSLNAKPGILRLKWKSYIYHYWWLLALFVLVWFVLTLGYTTYKFSVRQKEQRWKGRFDQVRELAADQEWGSMIRAVDALMLSELSDSELYNLMYLKANGYFQSSQLEEGRKQCLAILTRHPKDQQTMVLLGRLYLGLEDTSSDTLDAFRMLTTKEPSNIDGLKAYLKAMKSAGIYDSTTEKIAVKILDIESYNQEILRDLVEIYGRRQTRNEQACEVFKRYLELHPQDSAVLLLYLQSLVSVGNYIEAIRVGHRLLPINPELEDAHTTLIRAYDELNMNDELRAYYQDLCLELPQSRIVEKMFNLIQSSAGSSRTAEPVTSGIQDAEITLLALEEGKRLLGNKSYQDAILKLQTATQAPNLSFDAKILITQAYLGLQDMDAAILNFQSLNLKEKKLDNTAMDVVYEIAQHYEKTGEVKKAIQLLQVLARNDVTYRDTFQKIEILSLEV
jgi:tetratricopeptide (TPR) repeat protein